VPLDVEIVSPNRILLQTQTDELNLPGELGYLGILPGHTAFLSTLGQGELMYRQDGRHHYMTLFWGYLEVNNDKVTILAELAEPAAEIDQARADAARERAEERLRRFDDETTDFERARAALIRAMIRLQVARKASSS
jgi:F-type H+-transporting ATPase subunit epsilon